MALLAILKRVWQPDASIAIMAGRRRWQQTPGLSIKDFMQNVHIKLKFGNDIDKTDLWKAIIYEVDPDFPWSPMNRLDTVKKFCEKCGGWLWKTPFLSPQDLKKAAEQAGMVRKGPDDVRIQNFVLASTCGGVEVDRKIEEG